MTMFRNHDLQEIADRSGLEEPAALNGAGTAPAARTVVRLRLLWAQRRFLFRSAMCGLIVFTIIAFLIPKRYDSTTALMPPDDQSNSALAMAVGLAGKMGGGLAGVAGDVLGLKSTGDLFVGILRSRTVQDELVRKFELRKLYGQREWQGARRVLEVNTTISADRHSGIITITVTDKDPQRAAAMAEEYIAQLNVVVNRLTTSSARREREFLEERLGQVRQDLESAEKQFGDFSSKNTAIDIKEQARAMVGAAASLQGQLIATESELQGLKQIYADNNVRVRSLKARVAELHSQLDKLGGKDESGTISENTKDESLYPSIRKLPVLGIAFADLYRRTRVQEAIFETLTQEYELAKVAEVKETPSVKVLDLPNIPEHKSFPPRLLIMVLGAGFSLGGAVVWVFAKAFWSELHPQSAQKVFAQEILQTVGAGMPWASPNGSRFRATAHWFWGRLARRSNGSNGTEISRTSDTPYR